MQPLVTHYRMIASILAWIGIAVIIVVSVVPADDRPVTGAGQVFEHFVAYALVAGAFAISYRLPLSRLLLLALCICGVVELMQVPLPTRDARISDFMIDVVGAYTAIGVVFVGTKLFDSNFADKGS